MTLGSNFLNSLVNPSNHTNTAVSSESSNAPNTAASPEVSNKPNTAASPEVSNKPNTAVSPKASNKPNMAASPEVSNKPNTAASPEASNKPNTAASPKVSNPPNIPMSPNQMPNSSALPNASNISNISISPNTSNEASASAGSIMQVNKPQNNAAQKNNGMGAALGNACSDRQGTLPECAPLAVPYVPFQQKGPAKYNQMEGLATGTLFPGLNLPFFKAVEPGKLTNTALTELMALGFAIQELGLYLDTHQNDSEALELFTKYVELEREGRKKYIAMYGPLSMADAAGQSTYTWVNNPWPWDKERK